MLPKIISRTNSNNINKVFPASDYLMRFDGCSKGNPGKAGCGAVIYHKGWEIWSDSCFVGINETNNHAEYAGLILGLQKALELNVESLDVEGDSLLVIQQMNKIYKCKSPNLLELFVKANELSSKFKSIQFSHICRNRNKRADELSNMAML